MTLSANGEDLRPAHVAFFNMPAHGHVNPTLPVVAELVRRGHRVSYAMSAAFAPSIRAVGATPVVYRSTFPDPRRGERYPLDSVISLSAFFLNEGITTLPEQMAAFEADRPDVVVYDYSSYPGQILAERWDIPAVRTSPTRMPAEWYLDELVPLYEAFADDPRWVAYHRDFRRFLDRNGIDMSIEEFSYLGSADEYVATIPADFQDGPPAVGDRCTFVGPCIRKILEPTWTAPDDGRPVLFVSTGSITTELPDLYRDCVEAFGDSRWHVVLSIGHYVDPEDLAPLPSNVEVYAEVPQMEVLSRASMFITHAGMGATLEAIHHGVPMVAIPLVFDQLENARLISEFGLGTRIAVEEVTADRLREAVEAVASDPGTAARVAARRTAARSSAGPRLAAEVIERCLRNHAAGRRRPAHPSPEGRQPDLIDALRDGVI